MEAGFPPNTLTPKYADETLGACLAELARSLGTMPVKGDIDHKKAADPTFPKLRSIQTLLRCTSQRPLRHLSPEQLPVTKS